MTSHVMSTPMSNVQQNRRRRRSRVVSWVFFLSVVWTVLVSVGWECHVLLKVVSSNVNDARLFLQHKSVTEPRQCNSTQLATGQWMPLRLERPPYIPTYLNWRKECWTAEEVRKAPHWDTYEWRPHGCLFQKWKPDRFCQIMHNKTLAFIGDSLTLEHFNSLAHQLGFVGSMDEVWRRKGGSLTLKLCENNSTTLHFERTFYLEVVQAVLAKMTPDVMILNRGSWFEPDPRFRVTTQRRIPALEEWQQSCRTTGNCLGNLIYRTTVPGHPHCTQFTKPSTSIQEMEALVANQSWYDQDGNRSKFHWFDFKKQNEIMLDMLEKSALDYDVLPAYHMNILRPDGHTLNEKKGGADCLHNCALTGKIMVYNQALLHLLELQLSSKQ